MSPSSRAADVAIIGGGIVGAATAAFLAGSGARVRLYEHTAIAAAASGRNSGVIQHPFDSVLVGLYEESLGLYRALADQAENADPGDRFRLDSAPAGLLVVGRDAAAAAGLSEAWGARYPAARPEIVAGTALRELEPALAADLVACRLAIGYPATPAAATRAYAAIAKARGAVLRIGQAATITVDGERATGIDVDGRFEAAGAVVIATGPWTPAVVDPGGAWRPIRSVWGVVAQVGLEGAPRHVLEEVAIEIEPEDDAAMVARAGAFGFSLVTADGATSLGSTFVDTEPRQEALLPLLRKRGALYVPALAGAPFLGARSCARPVSLDGRPLVGRVPGMERAFVAAGHGPWGISTGPATARMIADLVVGRDAGIPLALDPGRFGPVPRPAASA